MAAKSAVPGAVTMANQPKRVILTYADYAEIPNDGKRYELWEGEIQMTPAPATRHQDAVGNLYALLRAHVRQHQLGRVFVAPVDVLLSDVSVVQPDVLFVARAHEAIILEPYVQGSPDLVVEVISPWNRRADLDVKRQLYGRYGVPNYWLLDPDAQEAHALVLEHEAYREVVSASGSDTFSAPPFPDLIIPLAEVWS
jgi:Uma2 family endonuclease